MTVTATTAACLEGDILEKKVFLRANRDHGWIHTLLEEAENERMHLLTFLKLKQPGPVFRFMVLVSQGVMFNAFFLAYIISPKTCHRFVGYIEEEAVHTYTVVRVLFSAGLVWFGSVLFSSGFRYFRKCSEG